MNQYSFKKQVKQTSTPHSKNSSYNRQNFAQYDPKKNAYSFNFNHQQNQSHQKKSQEKVDIKRYMKEYQYNANGNLYSGQKNSQSGKKIALKEWIHKPNQNKQKSSSLSKTYQYPLQDQPKISQYQKKDLFIYSPQFSTFSNQYERYSQGKIVKQLLQQNRLLKLQLSTKVQKIAILQEELLNINGQFKQKMTYFMQNSDKKQLQINQLSQKIKVYENYIQQFKNAEVQRNLQLKELLDKNFQLSNRIIQIKANYICKDQIVTLIRINNSQQSSNKKVVQLQNTKIVQLVKDNLTQKQKLQEFVLNIQKMKKKIQRTINYSNHDEHSSNKKVENLVDLEKDFLLSIDNLKNLWSWLKKIGHQYSRLKKFTDDQNQFLN